MGYRYSGSNPTLSAQNLKRIAGWAKEGLGGAWSEDEEQILYEFEDHASLISDLLKMYNCMICGNLSCIHQTINNVFERTFYNADDNLREEIIPRCRSPVSDFEFAFFDKYHREFGRKKEGRFRKKPVKKSEKKKIQTSSH